MSPKKHSKTEYPRLVVLSAPSGAGKTTLTRMLLQECPQFALSISATTRAKRPGEVEGIHYHFLSPEEFESRIKKGEFAEWAEVHGKRYGTLKPEIENAIAQGKHLLFDIDVQGAMSIQKLYPHRALLIFIHPPSMEELEQRLHGRKSDSATSIETRLSNAYNEMRWSPKFDYEITNDELPRAYNELKEILRRECP